MLQQGMKAKEIFGFIDDPKLRSSVRYFERITRNGFDPELNQVLLEMMRHLNETPDPEVDAGSPGRKPQGSSLKFNFNVQEMDESARSPMRSPGTQTSTDLPWPSSPPPALKVGASPPPAWASPPPLPPSPGMPPGSLDSRSRSVSPDPRAKPKSPAKPKGRPKPTTGQAPTFRSDTRTKEWEEHHKQLREEHDKIHQDTLAVKIAFRSQSSLAPEAAAAAKKKAHVTKGHAPTFRSDTRVKEHELHHDEIRKAHDAKCKDLVELRKQLHNQTTLDAKTMEFNKTHVSTGSCPTFKSDSRLEEWHQHHEELRQFHDAHHQDLEALRKHLHNQSTLGAEFGLEHDITGASFDKAPSPRGESPAKQSPEKHQFAKRGSFGGAPRKIMIPGT